MLSVYIIAAVFGGSLLLLSALGGGGDDAHADGVDALDVDVDVDADFDVHIDADVDADIDFHAASGTDLVVDHGVEGGADLASWLPFFSLRFWIYFAATFGLTGAIITSLELTSALFTGLLAAATGMIAGTGMVATVRALKKGESTSLRALDFESAEATASTTIRRGEVGKIRTHVRGEWVDLLAETMDDEPISPGESVIIVEMRGANATVVRSATILE
jgi:hypothetical protein